MEETSYFLHLVVKSDKPVVLTGSMRPSTAMSADGPLNIYNAVAIAADPAARGRGVLVTVDDDIHSAHDIVKTHTTDVGTMSSGEAGLVGATLFGKNTWYRTPAGVHTKSERLQDRRRQRPAAGRHHLRARQHVARRHHARRSRTAPRVSSSPASATAT